jgi:hypothetical protein
VTEAFVDAGHADERIVTDNGACYRTSAFSGAVAGSRHQRTKLDTPQHKS